MVSTVAGIRRFLDGSGDAVAAYANAREAVEELFRTTEFDALVTILIEAPAFCETLGRDFAESGAVAAISACRMLRGCLNMPLGQFFLSLGQVLSALESPDDGGRLRGAAWLSLADRVADSPDVADVKLLDYLTTVINDQAINRRYRDLAEDLVDCNPHALYPTSAYRACDGHVQSSADQRTVEAVMSFSTFSSIRVVDRILDPLDRTLRDIYRPLGRCVCFIDCNVEEFYGAELDAYFQHHAIRLETLAYRAMEVDKGIATVERMLGDLKRVGIARHEPVLIMGGGVLADTGGLACALYGRNTPYVMLATSIVTGIDAGPSPRTCCDGFGYKNLLGAYHPPVVSITDRFFFKSLRAGWLRHGVAEIVKMSVVKNAELFADLEQASDGLVETRFGTVECGPGDPMHALSQRILGGALKSYIEAEYDNLYETHQCRPHAYGHTWSPGFEIEAGLLHGHAVSVDMGFGRVSQPPRGMDRAERVRADPAPGLRLWIEPVARHPARPHGHA